MNARAAVLVTGALAPPAEPGRDDAVVPRLERVQNEARFVGVEAGWLRARFPDNPVGLYHRSLILEGLERPAEALVAWDALVAHIGAFAHRRDGFLAE